MCPFRVLVILFSLLIALLATMAALAKDPADEEAELHAQSAAEPKSVWARFVDFWTGRYLYREAKRMMPACFFSAEEEEEEQSADSDATAPAPADDQCTPGGEDGHVAPVELVEPSAPELDADADADAPAAAFERAYKRHPQAHVAGLHDAGIVGAS